MSISPREFNEMVRRVAKLEQELAQRPLRGGGGSSTPVFSLVIVGGNTLSDGSTLGIKKVSSAITSVPSAYDPTITSAFIDGIGRAQLWINGAVQSSFVLVVHDSRTSFGEALFSSETVLASPTTASIPVAGDPNGATVTCYIPVTP